MFSRTSDAAREGLETPLQKYEKIPDRPRLPGKSLAYETVFNTKFQSVPECCVNVRQMS